MGGRSQAGYCGSNAHLLHLCLLTYVCNAYRVPCSHRNYVQYVGTLLRIVWCECELQSHITDRPLAHKTCLSHKAAVRGLGSSWLAGSLNPAQSQSPPARPVQTMLRCSLTWTGYISGLFAARGHAELKIIGSYWHNPYFYRVLLCYITTHLLHIYKTNRSSSTAYLILGVYSVVPGNLWIPTEKSE